MSEAIEMALKSEPALQRAAAQVRRAEAQEGQARSRLRPELSLSATDTGQTFNLETLGIDSSFLPAVPVKAGPFQMVDARAAATQTLWNASLRDRVAESQEQVKTSRFLALDTHQLVAFQVALAFAQALRTQSAADTLEKQLGLARKLHATTLDRLGAGV